MFGNWKRDGGTRGSWQSVWLLAIISIVGFIASCGQSPPASPPTPPSPATTAPAAFIYVANADDGTVSEFQVNRDTGQLSIPGGGSTPPKFPAGTSPSAIAADPLGSFLYVTTTDGIAGFSADPASGELTPVNGSPFVLKGSVPSDITIDPNGTFAYVAFFGSNQVASYRISRDDGALTPAATVASGIGPYSLATDAVGHFLYEGDFAPGASSGTVTAYVINANNGEFSPAPRSPYVVGEQASSISIGNGFVFVNTGQPNLPVYGFTVNGDTGALRVIMNSPFPGQPQVLEPHALLTDVQGRFVWTAFPSTTTTPDKIVIHPVETTSGRLLKTVVQDNLPSLPLILAADPSGKFMYTLDRGAGCATGAGCADHVSSWKIGGTSGTLSQISSLPTGALNSSAIAIARLHLK
jgi:6-phosphogluconolactonase (cycloisomerase 2 family)